MVEEEKRTKGEFNNNKNNNNNYKKKTKKQQIWKTIPPFGPRHKFQPFDSLLPTRGGAQEVPICLTVFFKKRNKKGMLIFPVIFFQYFPV